MLISCGHSTQNSDHLNAIVLRKDLLCGHLCDHSLCGEYESNARFVRWSDGSLQLLIGNEVLDINVQDAKHDLVIAKGNSAITRKKEKVNKKYTPVIDRRRQLSPGFLEDALEEEKLDDDIWTDDK
ncbi:Protein LEO1-like protein, partial [Cucurbita argyrosperma subsp. sororia]